MSKKLPQSPPRVVASDEVVAEAARSGFALAPAQAEALAAYLTLLLKWSRVMNLVGRATWPAVFRDLAADSLHLAAFLRGLPLPAAPLTLDLGAGAGLPGVPLRCVWTAGTYVMVELREKRAVFLRRAVAEARLARTFALRGRAEEAGAELARSGLPERADVVVSRAFLPWPKLLPLAAGLLAPGGRLVVLANVPPPADLGPGFALEAAREYPSGGVFSGAGPTGAGPADDGPLGERPRGEAPAKGKRRYFWVLIPASC